MSNRDYTQMSQRSLKSRRRQRDERQARIVAMYREGVIQADLVRHFNVSPGTITRALRAAGIDVAADRRARVEKRTQHILKLRAQGMSIGRIAQALSVSHMTVKRTLDQAKPPTTPEPPGTD